MSEKKPKTTKKKGVTKKPANKPTKKKSDFVPFEDLPAEKQLELEAEAEVMNLASGKQLWANRQNAKKAGKPKGSVSQTTLLKRKMNAMMVRMVDEKFGDLMRTKMDLALGHQVYAVVMDETTGKPMIDPKTKMPIVQLVQIAQPDPKSSEYLLDHVLGKSTIKVQDVEPEGLDEDLSEEDRAHVERIMKVMAEDYEEETV